MSGATERFFLSSTNLIHTSIVNTSHLSIPYTSGSMLPLLSIHSSTTQHLLLIQIRFIRPLCHDLTIAVEQCYSTHRTVFVQFQTTYDYNKEHKFNILQDLKSSVSAR